MNTDGAHSLLQNREVFLTRWITQAAPPRGWKTARKNRMRSKRSQQKTRKHRKSRKTLRKRGVRGGTRALKHRVQRGGNPKLLAPYFRAIADNLKEGLPSIKAGYDEDLETTGILPSDAETRAQLDLTHLSDMYDALQDAIADNNDLQANPHETAENKEKSKRELAELQAEFNRLRNLQKLQDAALDDPNVAHHERGDVHIIDVQFFNLVPMGISIAEHGFDVRFIGRLRNRMKDGAGFLTIEVGPAFRRGPMGAGGIRAPSRFQRALPHLDGDILLAVFEDNAFGRIVRAFEEAEEAAYAEAEAGGGGAAAAAGPPALHRFSHMSFESPFAAAAEPGGGMGYGAGGYGAGGLGAGGLGPGVARTLSYNSPMARTLSAPPSSAGSVAAPYTPPPAHPGGAAAAPPAPGRRQGLPHLFQVTGRPNLMNTNNNSKHPEEGDE